MDVLKTIKKILSKSLCKSDSALLFGSRARGTAHDGSDWDILIILDKDKLENDDYDNISFPLTFLGWEIGEIISPILYTKNEWLKQKVTPFFKNVQKDSISLI